MGSHGAFCYAWLAARTFHAARRQAARTRPAAALPRAVAGRPCGTFREGLTGSGLSGLRFPRRESVERSASRSVRGRAGGTMTEERRMGLAMSGVDALVAKAAPTLLSVLLRGETGVGKDVLAERQHAE